ncbi:hypothetical protein GQR36_08440 [Enterococcus termitis]
MSNNKSKKKQPTNGQTKQKQTKKEQPTNNKKQSHYDPGACSDHFGRSFFFDLVLHKFGLPGSFQSIL